VAGRAVQFQPAHLHLPQSRGGSFFFFLGFYHSRGEYPNPVHKSLTLGWGGNPSCSPIQSWALAPPPCHPHPHPTFSTVQRINIPSGTKALKNHCVGIYLLDEVFQSLNSWDLKRKG